MVSPDILRKRRGSHERVTFVELFFDLIFVFAVTQLSHLLLHHYTPLGGLQTLMLMMAVWWAWVFTTWVTNWFDPENNLVRGLLLLLMFIGLILACAVPDAFGKMGLVFASAYVAIQFGRSAGCALLLRKLDENNYHNFLRISAWMGVSAVLWIAGGIVHQVPLRMALWGVALAIEYAGPVMGFLTPGLGRSLTTDWKVEGGHIAERCALFIIIALGESILLTGTTFEKLPWSGENIAAFAAAFLGSVIMWWLYFDISAEKASDHISHSSDPGRMARFSYTYIHIILVAGIILCAVSDEFLLTHPHHAAGAKYAIAILGGPALYLLGSILFKLSILRCFSGPCLAGIVILATAVPFSEKLTILGIAYISVIALGIAAVGESLLLRRRRFKG